MAIEPDSVEIENLALLKFRAPPDRRERGQANVPCTVSRLHSNDHRSVFVGHREKVINRFEVAGNFFLSRFSDFLFLSIDNFFYLHRFLYGAIQPVDAGHIGTKIQAQRRIITQKLCDIARVFIVDLERMLLRRARILQDLDLRARHRGFDPRFDLLQAFHSLDAFDRRRMKHV